MPAHRSRSWRLYLRCGLSTRSRRTLSPPRLERASGADLLSYVLLRVHTSILRNAPPHTPSIGAPAPARRKRLLGRATCVLLHVPSAFMLPACGSPGLDPGAACATLSPVGSSGLVQRVIWPAICPGPAPYQTNLSAPETLIGTPLGRFGYDFVNGGVFGCNLGARNLSWLVPVRCRHRRRLPLVCFFCCNCPAENAMLS